MLNADSMQLIKQGFWPDETATYIIEGLVQLCLPTRWFDKTIGTQPRV